MAGSLTPSTNSLFDFGPLAEDYENWYGTSDGQEHDLAQQQDVLELLRHTSPHGDLLDVGCGSGHWSRFFQSLGYKVHGIDISESMIRVARMASQECVFDIADACALPFQDASFDIVASMATLGFITTPHIAVREMVRCVKPGGCLIIGALNRLAPLNQDRLSRAAQPYASGWLFSPQELWDLLSPSGKLRMVASSRIKNPASLSRLVIGHRPSPTQFLASPFLIVRRCNDDHSSGSQSVPARNASDRRND